MSYQPSSIGRIDAMNAAKGQPTIGTANYSQEPACDYCNKPMLNKLDLSAPESVITSVCKDHGKIRQLFSQYKLLPLTELQERENSAAAIIRELCIHSWLEENVLYPQYKVMLGEMEGKAAEKHSIDEHAKLKQMLQELDQNFDVKSTSFSTRLEEIMRVFNHHSHEEEGDFLAQLQAKTLPEKLIDWGKQFESKRKIAPTRPHPYASTSTAAAVLTKPMDALRDAADGRTGMAQRASNRE